MCGNFILPRGEKSLWIFCSSVQLDFTINQQRRIADFIDCKVADINAIISAKQEQLTVLDEYKKSTIYEYVTGKKEVPNE